MLTLYVYDDDQRFCLEIPVTIIDDMVIIPSFEIPLVEDISE